MPPGNDGNSGNSAANYFVNPDGSTPAPRPLDSALRGLSILQVALSVSLVTGLLNGAVWAYYMAALMGHGGGTAPLLMAMKVGQLMFLGTALAELFALSKLTSAPPESRVAELARPAIALRGVELAVMLLTWGLPYLLDSSGNAVQRALTHTYIGIAETVIGLTATVLIVELLLRLRRFAAPASAQLGENESLLRAGILGAVLARTVINYVSYALVFHFLGMDRTGQWAALALRLPFTLLFYGLLLWLVQSTITAVRSYQPAGAAADPLVGADAEAVAQDTSAAGYRNMMIGGLWAVGGIAITALTYSSAQQLGGRYTIAYGAIIFGGIQFFRGLTQLGGKK